MSTIWVDLKMCMHKAVIACYLSSAELNLEFSWKSTPENTRSREVHCAIHSSIVHLSVVTTDKTLV